MSIACHCPNGHPLNVKDELAAKQVSCPVCECPFVVPGSLDISSADDVNQSLFDDLDLPEAVIPNTPTPTGFPAIVVSTPQPESVRNLRVGNQSKDDDSGLAGNPITVGQVLLSPIFIASFVGGTLLMSLVIGGALLLAWPDESSFAEVVTETDQVQSPVNSAAPMPSGVTDSASSSDVHHRTENQAAASASTDSTQNSRLMTAEEAISQAMSKASATIQSAPPASRPSGKSGTESLGFHPVGVVVSPDDKTAFVWGGAMKDLYNFEAACGPPYQIAVLDIETRTVKCVSTTASPILEAAIDDNTLCAVMVKPSDYGDRDHSPKELSLATFNSVTLDPEAFGNVVAVGKTLEIVAKKYVVIDGVHRFRLPDLQTLPVIAKVERHRFEGGWIWENAVWNQELDKPQLLVSLNRNRWPIASLPDAVSSLVSSESDIPSSVSVVQRRLNWSSVATDKKGRKSEFRIEPVQTSLSLNAREPTTVRYAASTAANYTIELRARHRNTEPFFHAESGTGVFDIQLPSSEESLLPTFLGKLVSEGSTFLSDRDFIDYLGTGASEYREYTGQSPEGIPTAILATVKATSKSGDVAVLEHQYLVDLPNKTLREALLARTSLPALERGDIDSNKNTQPEPPRSTDRETSSQQIAGSMDKATQTQRRPHAKPSAVDLATEDITFDPSKPELAISEFSKVRFTFQSGNHDAYYLPPGVAEEEENQILATFSPGRGFPLRPAVPGTTITTVEIAEEDRQVITDIERWEGCDRLTLQEFGGIKSAAQFDTQPILWSKEGNAAFILNNKSQLFRINLDSWLIDAAVQLPETSEVQSCQQGIVVLGIALRNSSSRSPWIDMGHEPEGHNAPRNTLFLLDESTLAVQATAITSANAIAGHQQSPVVLLSEPHLKQTTAINTKHWELIGSLDEQMPWKFKYSQHMAAKGFVCLRGVNADNLQLVRERISSLIECCYSPQTKVSVGNGRLAYSEDGSNALFFRNDVKNVLLTSVEEMPSIEHPVIENLQPPLSLGMNTATNTFYLAARAGMYTYSPMFVRVFDATHRTEVVFDLPPNVAPAISIRVASNGKGSFVRSLTGFYWLQPSLASLKAKEDRLEDRGPTGESKSMLVENGGKNAVPLYATVESKTPLNVATLAEMGVKARRTYRTKPEGFDAFIIIADWYDWDPDGEHFYVINRTERHLICVDATTKQEIKRLAVPDWEVHPNHFLLSQKGIMYLSPTHLVMIEYKTLKPLWKIPLSASSSQLHAHPSHNFIVLARQEEAVFYDPNTGVVSERMTADKVETFTKGLLKRTERGFRATIALTSELPVGVNYAPQGFIYSTHLDPHSQVKKTILEMRHMSEKVGKRFKGPLPEFFRTFKPHPTDPLRLLILDEFVVWLSMVDAGNVSNP